MCRAGEVSAAARLLSGVPEMGPEPDEFTSNRATVCCAMEAIVRSMNSTEKDLLRSSRSNHIYLMLAILLLKKQDKVEEIRAKTFVAPVDVMVPALDIVDTTVSVPSSKNANYVSTNFVAHPPSKKPALRMSAHEDHVKLDDDVHSNRDVSTLTVEERKKLKMLVVENRALATEAAY
ncbi:hypothetical protein F0562_002770 [Nyssa sinensis]|uniref:Uncharacterized protein n=1 Tax=Nyssa sinensis TaxID=561372 RepID=A0A5J5BYY6_9ASTE|nr:hypothetical protein F0562_002770 [Nyssa sinensis]